MKTALSYLPSIYSFSPLALVIGGLVSFSLQAQENAIEVVEVSGHQQNYSNQLGSMDQILKQQGVDFSEAGGMSSLPVINGMMGDRVKVLIDGADITASCANQMNPPLSYISANQVEAVTVIAGIGPVSAGGDNIAGVINVSEIAPVYVDATQIQWHSGYVSAQYNSNTQAKSFGVGARVASKNVSFNYQGSFEDANSYDDGHGDKVADTLYRAQNHALTGAIKDDKQQLAVKLTHQFIPFQGFANQYMDMTDNKSYGITSLYQRQMQNGEFEAQLNWHSVKHEMGFFSQEKVGMMPMNTEADDYSYRLNWKFETSAGSSVNLGHEYFDYRLDDWWPAVEGSMMMGPNDYININNGKRQRVAAFAEIMQSFDRNWHLYGGVRVEHVTTNTGEVQAYTESSMGMSMGASSMDMGSSMSMSSNAEAAAMFNAMDRKRSDTVVDATITLRYQLDTEQQFELGIARKNRAPNLYERYSWGVSTMATTMIGWFGDGNGYKGNPDLDPETAHTISATYINTAKNDDWSINVNAWYTKVDDYIDAEVISSFNSSSSESGTRNILQFTNVDASLYGIKLDALVELADSKTLGHWDISANLASTHGERDNDNGYLYQIVPLKTELSLQHQMGNWRNAIQWQWIDSKTDVDERRLENTTKSYHLVNLQSEVNWQDLTLKFAVDNVFDTYYELPMGGVSVADYRADASQGFNQLAGAGRSVNVGVSYTF